jgi:hypothetical protein
MTHCALLKNPAVGQAVPPASIPCETRRPDISQSAFPLIFVERFLSPRGDIAKSAVKRRQGFFVKGRASGISGILQVFKQETRKFSLILRQVVQEVVKGVLSGASGLAFLCALSLDASKSG